ncbi:MAG: error-prone DNA polymerase, partial [Candidatus Dadabacteria bacterium]
KYFLACYDITEFARQKNILYQGRGAAANSAVCYVLGITAVDPEKIDLLFARFISKERNEPPDIDIDFEHERREEVIRYIYNKYGREFTALVSEVITYRHRSALRDTAKAFGFSVDTTNRLTSLLHSWTGYQITSQQLEELGLNKDSLALKHVFEISNQLLGFPRHLSQHSSGFIISKYPLSRIVPIGKSAMPGRTIIEWDKNDIEELAILKIDILALGMLTCIRKALTAINTERTKKGKKPLSLYSIPPEDPKVYDMICAADTIGVFQIESRAQMSMLPRLKPRSFYDLVIEVAIVRPGPIQGKMVHPYLKRRNSSEKVSYPDKNVEQILGKTLGVPIFQEQAMKLAIILAGFSPGEAEKLRRAMAAWKRNSDAIAAFEKRIISGMLSKGYSAEFAKSCVNQIKGFSEYGFPESHAASFALLVYISAWIKCYYPAEFAMALLNSQPMGFYAPSQIIQDAKRHGVKVLPVDINYSFWDSSIENSTGSKALRLGFRMVSGINKKDIIRLIKIRALFKFFESITELSREFAELGYELPRDTLIRLARADAFRSMGLNARKALWKIKALPKTFLPLDSYWKNRPELFSPPLESSYSLMLKDYQSTGLSLRAHPLEFLRAKLKKRGILSKKELLLINPENSRAPFFTAGIVICRQKPPTAKGVMFITLEDETGSVNLIVAPDVFKRYQRIIMSTDMIIAGGMLQKNGPLVYLNVFELRELDLAALT